MELVREALIVATDTFEHPKLRRLGAPASDAEELARVLGDPEIGDFHVQVSLNEPDHIVRRRLSEFFRDRRRDDLLLLHVSSHGLKDEDGTLYFATTNTDVDHLEATAIPSEFVNRQMTRSRSARVLLLLDCCFGGAFARGFVHRAGEGVDVAEEFDGRGRVVLTASRAMEWAFEGDHLEGEARPSIFTSAVVDGLETGRADRDQDSRISVDELYDYVYDHVREVTPNQTPSKWTFDVQGDLYVAKSSYRAEIEPADLPLELRAAIDSPFAHVRGGAVEELARLLRGTHPGLALSARFALERLVEDDSRLVSEAATRRLELEGPQEPAQVSEPASAGVEAPAEEHEPKPAPVPASAPGHAREVRPLLARSRAISLDSARQLVFAAARARRWSAPLALVGAAALVVGYVGKTGLGGDESQWQFALEYLDPYYTGYYDYDNVVWFVWSPIEVFGVAFLAAAVAVIGTVAGLAREAADGLLIGLGLLTVAGSFAVLGPYAPSRAFYLTLLGGIAIAAAGALGAGTKRAADVPESPRWALLAGGAGAALLLVTLFLDVVSEYGHLGEKGREFWVELAAAVGLAVAATALAYRLPRARLYAGGLLIAVGLQSALHLSGLLLQLFKFKGNNLMEDQSWRFGIVVGLLAATLLVVAGVSILRAGMRPRAPRRAPAAAST